MAEETITASHLQAVSPVEPIPTDPKDEKRDAGTALCLSGGGYRAMLFHVGTLWRLNQVGWLPRLERISSVSGGSITAGVLGINWSSLVFNDNGVSDNFVQLIVEPLRKIAGRTIDAGSVISGALLPGSIGDRVVSSYKRHLFAEKTLQDLPDRPRFVINATNVQSGALWRFMKPYMRDYRVGEVRNPTIEIAIAVAASSAFPPMLSPVELDLDGATFTDESGTDLQREPFTTEVVLTDGGVYDNLGLETAWKRYDTILVSDAGGKMDAEAEPKRDWARHAYRVLEIVDNQVRSLRKRQVIESFKLQQRKGAYWGIRSDINRYPVTDGFSFDHAKTIKLANVPTRLKRLDPTLQEQLINWGYAVCNAALRSHVDSALEAPESLPYPEAGIE